MFGVALEELHAVIGRIQAEAGEVPATRLSYDLFKVRSAIDKLEDVSQQLLAAYPQCPLCRTEQDVPWIA